MRAPAEPSLAVSRQEGDIPCSLLAEVHVVMLLQVPGGDRAASLGLATAGVGNSQALSSLVCEVKCLGHQSTTDTLNHLLSWFSTVT